MDDAPRSHPRGFRFGLRTLLVVVALAAVASWSYWIGWPWWRDYRRRAAFESTVIRLKAGDSIDNAFDLLSPGGDVLTAFPPPPIREPGPEFAMSTYELSGADYCVFFRLSPRGRYHCSSLQVYRLTPMPPGYHRQVTKVASWPMHMSANDPSPSHYPQIEYTDDFFIFLIGNRKSNPGFQYELIYSDPPAKPELK